MTTESPSTIMPVQIDDFADRVACLQNLYKDLISAHPCAQVFGRQLDIVGTAISDLADQAHLASLYCLANVHGRQEIMREAKRVANMSRATPRT
jgi:hypothetical protein